MILIPTEVLDDAREIGKRRIDLHRGQKSYRILSKDENKEINYAMIGILGEWAFAEYFDLQSDHETMMIAGDGRKDFLIGELTIDVKTARNAKYLFMEEGKVHSKVLVLSEYSEREKIIYFHGWEFAWVLGFMPVKDFGHGIRNHFLSRGLLRPVHMLGEIIEVLKKKGEVK